MRRYRAGDKRGMVAGIVVQPGSLARHLGIRGFVGSWAGKGPDGVLLLSLLLHRAAVFLQHRNNHHQQPLVGQERKIRGFLVLGFRLAGILLMIRSKQQDLGVDDFTKDVVVMKDQIGLDPLLSAIPGAL